MAQSGVMVSLPQMVDLALSCPEIGAVNFNILHTLLHVIIQQVDLLDCKVELKGDRSEKVQNLIDTHKPGPTINLTEYLVTPGKDQRKVITKKSKLKRIKTKGGDATKKPSKEEVLVERELKVIEQRKDSKEEPLPNPSPISSAIQLESSSMQTVIVVEPADGTERPYTSVSLSKAQFEKLEAEINNLKSDIQELREMPANMGLIDALRSSSVDKSSPVLDMFQILTLGKRVDATEAAISKLASMLEDLAKEQAAPHSLDASLAAGGFRGSLVQRASDLHLQMKGNKSAATGGASGGGPGGVGAAGAAGAAGARGSIIVSEVGISGDLKGILEGLDKRVKILEENIVQELGEKVAKLVAAQGDMDIPPEVRLTELETKLTEYTNQIATIDKMYNKEINVLQTQFTDLEKEIGEIVERINAGLPAGDFGADQNIADIYNNIMNMREEMEAVANNAAKILEEREERQFTLDTIVEQIELLKTVKADREDLEDALADKADACLVNRKVSHDQFDAACDDLSRSIEETLCKLTQQEQLWQQALDDIQREIENKLDKMELTPLRDFIHNKLKSLQERLKTLAAMKKETEAAGTKSKYLRNVQCISCDKDVVMRKQMDPTLMPPPPALPPTKSMGPYLAYELDALRRQQKCTPHGRNMNHFESAMAGAKVGKGADHICNRYCGGSHTVTTPQQRVSRLGHFLQQWGPELQPLTEGQIRGTDGQFYKSREADSGGQMRQFSLESEESETYVRGSKQARLSMVVQGTVFAKRSNLKSAGSKSEGEPQPSETKAPDQEAAAGEQRVSVSGAKRPSTASQRLSTSGGARASMGSAKRASTGGGRGSQQRLSRASASAVPVKESSSKQQSRISFKAPETEGAAEGEAENVTEDAAAAADAPAGEEALPAETEVEEGGAEADTAATTEGETPEPQGEAQPVAEAEAEESAPEAPAETAPAPEE